ncbi:hypothetical protein E4U30_004068 [Claviceps sp. LM220 group G6]|nr:hypothetical protein E4U30_004068 [Claviceps sp. LM220 group G6]
MFSRKSEYTGTVGVMKQEPGKNLPGWFERTPQILEKYRHFADVFTKVGDEAITAKTSVRSREADERAFQGRIYTKFDGPKKSQLKKAQKVRVIMYRRGLNTEWSSESRGIDSDQLMSMTQTRWISRFQI